MRSPPADATLPPTLAAVIVERSHSHKAGNLTPIDTAQLRQRRDHHARQLRADALDIPQQLFVCPPDRTVLNEGVNLAVHPVQFGLDDADQVIMADPHRLVVSPLQPDFSALSMPTSCSRRETSARSSWRWRSGMKRGWMFRASPKRAMIWASRASVLASLPDALAKSRT